MTPNLQEKTMNLIKKSKITTDNGTFYRILTWKYRPFEIDWEEGVLKQLFLFPITIIMNILFAYETQLWQGEYPPQEEHIDSWCSFLKKTALATHKRVIEERKCRFA